MKKNTPSHDYPCISVSDILSGGTVTFWRNPANEKFGETDKVEINECWDDVANIPKAFDKLLEKEKELSEKFPFAWDTDFGYLSPIPEHCGNAFQIQGEFHLEALHLIGDLPPVLNGIEAMRYISDHIVEDGITQAAHIYRIRNFAMLGISEEDLISRTTKIFRQIVRQEENARRTLVEEMPRILDDAVSRSLAILQSARLLAPGELLDILSPLRLAVTLGFVDGISRTEILRMMYDQLSAPQLPPAQCAADDRKRDARDAKLADKINKRFAKVKLSNLAKEYFS